MSLLWQGVIVEDYPWGKNYDPCQGQLVPGEKDEAPVAIFAIQAWLGVTWWLTTWFAYVKNFNTMKSGTGTNTVPLFWFWEFLTDPNYGWTAASYFSAFFTHLIVSFMELIAWFFYMGARPWWLSWWVNSMGWYFSVVGMIFPWLFAVFQLSFPEEDGGLDMDESVEFGYNSTFLIMGNLFAWVNASLTHVLLGDRLQCHVKAIGMEAKTVYKKCPVKRTFGTTNAEY